ncbi:hypothetical protein BDF21DRAFT_414508 [Thamnidium elegans]|nr:hypothetical protein BDF21DRAFT_414508 [Thamnidium elegans]
MTDDTIVPLATPTRFLIESGEWNLTPNMGESIQNEMNPFDCNFQQRTPKDIPTVTDKWASAPVIFTNTNYTSPEPEVLAFNSSSPSTPPMSLSQSPSSSSSFFSSLSSPSSISQSMQPTVTASTQDHHYHESTRRSSRIQTKQTFFSDYIDEEAEDIKPRTASVQSGRKRRIVFEGDDAEDRRKKFLERNRVAAYKCRQKKKNWMQELEQKADIQNNRNEELRSIVAQLREESMYLRNLLLSHGNCDCESVQAYLRKTSAEITSKTVIPHHHHNVSSRRASIASYSSVPTSAVAASMPPYQASFSTIPPFPETSTGLTPFLNTVINKSEPSNDYFSHSHSTTDS